VSLSRWIRFGGAEALPRSNLHADCACVECARCAVGRAAGEAAAPGTLWIYTLVSRNAFMRVALVSSLAVLDLACTAAASRVSSCNGWLVSLRMKDVISVEKAPGSDNSKRAKRLEAAIQLHKVKRTPSHRRAHYERRQQAKDQAWELARSRQQHRRVELVDEDTPVVEEAQAQTPRRRLRSVVVIE
jgi:hypothetical protein